MLDFRQITLFCFGYRLLKHKMTICSEYLGGHGPLGPLGYSYVWGLRAQVENHCLTLIFADNASLCSICMFQLNHFCLVIQSHIF